MASQEIEYPSIVRRFQGSFIDGIITFMVIGGLMAVANAIDENSSWMKIVALVIGLSYEPLMSRYAYTAGQGIMRMRVISADAGTLTLFSTYLRLRHRRKGHVFSRRQEIALYYEL